MFSYHPNHANPAEDPQSESCSLSSSSWSGSKAATHLDGTIWPDPDRERGLRVTAAPLDHGNRPSLAAQRPGELTTCESRQAYTSARRRCPLKGSLATPLLDLPTSRALPQLTASSAPQTINATQRLTLVMQQHVELFPCSIFLQIVDRERLGGRGRSSRGGRRNGDVGHLCNNLDERRSGEGDDVKVERYRRSR